MEGCHVFNPAKVKVVSTPDIHGVVFGHSLASQPGDDLKTADDGGSCLEGEVRGIGHMVGMAVADEDVIRLDGFEIHRPGEVVGTNKWIEKKLPASSLDKKARMTVIGEFHPSSFHKLKPFLSMVQAGSLPDTFPQDFFAFFHRRAIVRAFIKE